MERPVAQNQIALPDIPAVGEVLAEKYRVEGILGVGGMGVVLGARHLQLGQSVAIKVLSVSHEQRNDAVERFLREGRAAAALNSDHVVRIYDVGQLPTGVPFMVMERLRGQDLASFLAASGPLAVADAIDYVAQATMAIVDAHEVGIVHRDLKPANLFRTQRSDGSVCIKVLDFGISKQLTDLETQTLQGALTSTRQVMGSPAYMSPEQVRDAKNVDHRTDIWALGVTLYELLTQQAAFDAETLPAICAAIAADPPVPIRARRADVPEAIAAIVARCLEKQPANRYPTARALLAALRAFQGGDVAVSSVGGPTPATEATLLRESAEQKERKVEAGWIESGPRSVGTTEREGVDGTLVSGRLAASPQVEVAPTSATRGFATNRRRWWFAAIVLLVCGGAATTWIGGRRVGPIERAKAVQSDPAQPQAPQAPPNDSETVARAAATPTKTEVVPLAQNAEAPESQGARAQFALRIESNPSQALVIEGGNPLGVTPLSIRVDRTVVRQSPRVFVLRKAGFVDVVIQQGDSLTDVQQSVVLTRGRDLTAESRPAKAAPRATGSTAPINSAPGIRISR